MIDKLYKIYLHSGRKISTDTRQIIAGSIFFALKGKSFDGNEFAAEAIKKGASYSIIDDKKYKTDKTILVDNVLYTLQNLATYCRKKESYHVLALTGTNGKTTTKELIKNILSIKYKCFATLGNLNNHIGVPLTILNTPANTEILIIEMGANHLGEIGTLCKIALPDSGIITNIGKAHLEGFGNFEGVKSAKSELYHFLKEMNKPIFINTADPTLTEVLGNYENTLSYGSMQSNCYASLVKFDGKLKVEITSDGNRFDLYTNLFGKYNVTNIMAACRVGKYFSVDLKQAAAAISNYIPQNNRSQIKQTKNNKLILDSYNANPTSMKAALDSFFEIKEKNKVVILGEMKELGDQSHKEHELLFKLLTSNDLIISYFIGESFSTFSKIHPNVFNSTKEFQEHLKINKLSNSLILLKGSRVNKLETLIDYL